MVLAGEVGDHLTKAKEEAPAGAIREGREKNSYTERYVMRTSEVINIAADQVEARGWTPGNSGWGTDGPVCTEGAIDAALGYVRFDNIFAFWACPAYLAVANYLGLNTLPPDGWLELGPIEPLWMWNDAPGRTASEVIEVLRATALVEAAREDAALLAEAGRS